MQTLPANFRLGARPEDIISSLRKARKRFMHRRVQVRDRKRNLEYYALMRMRAYYRKRQKQ